jgi:N-acetyl-anhydromuramyl-L-alanine amidase AmpD
MIHEQHIPHHVTYPFWKRSSLDVREEAIGIEIVGVATGTLTAEQYGSLIPLIGRIRSRYALVRSRHAIVGHTDVQLNKGGCPELNFEWWTLADASIGTNFYRNPEAPNTGLDDIVSSRYPEWKSTGDQYIQLQRDLLRIGYSINATDHTSINGVFEGETKKALKAFRGHFMNSDDDSEPDTPTKRVLISVLIDLGVISLPPDGPQ